MEKAIKKINAHKTSKKAVKKQIEEWESSDDEDVPDTPADIARYINEKTQAMAQTLTIKTKWNTEKNKYDKTPMFKTGYPNSTKDNVSVSDSHNAVSIYCSKYSNVSVLDIDDKNGKQIVKKLKNGGMLPDNIWIDYTVNGGSHIYFQSDEDLFKLKNATQCLYNNIQFDYLTNYQSFCGGTSIKVKDGELKYTWDDDYNPFTVKVLDKIPETLKNIIIKAILEKYPERKKDAPKTKTTRKKKTIVNTALDNYKSLDEIDTTNWEEEELEVLNTLKELPACPEEPPMPNYPDWTAHLNFIQMGLDLAIINGKDNERSINMFIGWGKDLPNKNVVKEYYDSHTYKRKPSDKERTQAWGRLRRWSMYNRLEGLTEEAIDEILEELDKESNNNALEIEFLDFLQKWNLKDNKTVSTKEKFKEFAREYRRAFCTIWDKYGTYGTMNDGELQETKISKRGYLGKLDKFSIVINLIMNGYVSQREFTITELTDWMKLTNNKKKIMFKPYGTFEQARNIADRAYMNIFRPFKSKVLDRKHNPDKIKFMMKHLREVICNNNEKHLYFLLRWLRQCRFFPQEKPQVVIVCIDPHMRTGKNRFWDDFWKCYVLGDHNGIVEFIENIGKEFNGHRAGKTFCMFNEAGNTNSKQNSNWEKMKGMATDRTTMMRKLYHDAVEVNDYTGYVFCMNSLGGVKIGLGDARYEVLKINPQYKGNNIYFDNLKTEINQESANEFATMLWEGDFIKDDMTDIDFLRKSVPMSELKRDIIIHSLDSCQYFWYQKELELQQRIKALGVPDRSYLKQDWVSSKQIYPSYEDMCKNGNLSKIDIRHFGTYTLPLVEVKKARTNNLNWFNLNNIKILEKIQLDDDEKDNDKDMIDVVDTDNKFNFDDDDDDDYEEKPRMPKELQNKINKHLKDKAITSTQYGYLMNYSNSNHNEKLLENTINEEIQVYTKIKQTLEEIDNTKLNWSQKTELKEYLLQNQKNKDVYFELHCKQHTMENE